MVSAIPVILVPDLDVDIPVLDRYRIGLRRNDRRQARDLAGPHVEARAMPWAFDRHLPELPLAERVFLMGAGVADRVEVVVLRVDQPDRLSLHFHPLHPLPCYPPCASAPLSAHPTPRHTLD